MLVLQRTGMVFILMAGIVLSQFMVMRHQVNELELAPLLPQAPVLKATDLGLHSATASLVWLTTIQKFGALGKFATLGGFIRVVNDMDPRFGYPYAFAALVLPSFGKTEEAIAIANRGIAEADPDWQIPYYLAVTHHIDLKDRLQAARYFNVAAHTPGAPDNVRYVAATYGNRQDLRSQTKLIWLSIYENSKDEIVREQAKTYIVHIEILERIEHAASLYKDRFGKYPEAIDELVRTGFLKTVPRDPFGFPYSITKEGNAVLKAEFGKPREERQK